MKHHNIDEMKDEYVMIVCNSPVDAGYEDDIMFFLFFKEYFETFQIPEAYRYAVN
jgi:hypothetical protein